MLAVGRIAPVKNYELLIAAAQRVIAVHADVDFVVAGGAHAPGMEAYLAQLQELAAAHGLGSRFQFIGPQPFAAVPGLYHSAAVAVNLCGTGGMDKAVLEGFSCGLPTVVRNATFDALLAEDAPELLDNLELCELVCLDDLDAVAGRSDWEEGLFHLFNRLRDSGRRLLLAGTMSPRELPIQLPDLKSRLTLALVFQLHELSDEDKLRALQLRASRRGLQMSDEVGRFILTRGERSMSALFELLERLDQASLQAQRKLTIPFLKETLGW